MMKSTPNKTKKNKGLPINRHFTAAGKSPYDQFTYQTRSSVIRNPTGDEVFRMDDVEVPEGWSQVATDILAQKYFRKTGVPVKGQATTGSENSIKQVAHRLASCWQHWGNEYGYFASEADSKTFYDELVYMLLAQMAAPNSPQWFNTGLHQSYGITGAPQGHYYIDPKSGQMMTLPQLMSGLNPTPASSFRWMMTW